MIKQLAKFSYKHKVIVCFIWFFILVAVIVWARSSGNAFSSNFKLSGTDSQAAIDLLDKKFPTQAGSTGYVVFKADTGMSNQATKVEIGQVLNQIGQTNEVTAIESPYSAHNQNLTSQDGKITYAIVHFRGIVTEVSPQTVKTIQDIALKANTSSLQVELGGDVFSTFRPVLTSEGIGIAAAIIILLFAFGSIIAAGLPIIIALMGIGIGISAVELLAHLIVLPNFSTELGAMLGIGVGIDYALLIITRYRQNIATKLTPEEATIRAINTAGRSVIFAGTAVVISLLGMLLMNVSFIQGLGLASAIVVAITMLAAITLLPAILGFVGTKIDTLKIHKMKNSDNDSLVFWRKWSDFILDHSWSSLIFGTLILLTLAVPFLSIRLGSSDSSSHPVTDTTRRAYDLISQGFGVGSNGPLIVSADINGPKDLAIINNLSKVLLRTSGVAQVFPAQSNKQFSAVVMQVIPTTSPQDAKTVQLINNIRDTIIPSVTGGSDVNIHVGGITATFSDLAQRLQSRLPIFIIVVLSVSFIFLLLVFRSILIPIKAVVMNILSIGAAYGVVVAVFQWGWAKNLVGIGQSGPIDSYLPMMMFAIVFGLSMDYEVFLLSRIKEEYDHTHNNDEAVSEGLARTAKVITAAALIMVTVFASFIITNFRILKEFGLGLSVAIFLDATIVRLVIVPVIMKLLGKANWWFPKWLNWLPKFHIDEGDLGS
jgi:RND superfamily putative drug exporter